MKVRRLLIIALTLAMLAMGLTACGKNTDEPAKKSGDTNTTEATPTSTPTPTEEVKSPEQLDLEAIDLIFASARETALDTEYNLEEGAVFSLTFYDDHLLLDLETKNNSLKRKICEKWMNGARISRSECPMQSQKYMEGSKYGTIVGVVGAGGNIQWTANNLSAELFDTLGKKGVAVSPAYTQRQELFKEIRGEWTGDVSISLKYLVDNIIDKNDKETISFYYDLISFLKNYGFSGNLPISIGATILSEKEMQFVMTIDWSGFLGAIDKATATEDGMLKFLSACTGADKSAIKAYVKSEGTTVMAFGRAVVKLLKNTCAEYPGENALCSYDLSGNTLLITGTDTSDQLIYNKDKGTMTYKDMGIECVLKKK